MKPYISYTRDSADLKTSRHYFYYGPMMIDQTSQEWCGIVNKGGKEVARYTNSQLLEVSNGESPKDLLIALIALYLG